LRAKSFLLLPPPELCGCIFAGIVRDTRSVELNDRERLSFFPSSPLVAITHVIEGEIRLIPEGNGVDDLQHAQALERTSVLAGQDRPTVSWSPGPALVVSVGFFPDAWNQLVGKAEISELLERAFSVDDEPINGWKIFCSGLSPLWRKARTDSMPMMSVVAEMSDWARGLVSRAALTGAGRGVRSIERRLKRWTHQSQQSLSFYASIDELHRISAKSPEAPLAEIALDAGFSDQSHMGRAVRRATGFSPAQLNRLIETDESFWCYRLLGERF
jgi:AraC-like DNA-binding protein